MKYEEQRKNPQEWKEKETGASVQGTAVIPEQWDGEHPSMMALSRYLSEEDPAPEEVMAYTRHLAACPECRQLAWAMQNLEQAAALADEYGQYAEEDLEDFLEETNARSGLSQFSPDRLTRETLSGWSAGEVVFRFTGRWEGDRFTLGEEGAETLRLSSLFRGEYLRLTARFDGEALCVEMEGRKNGWHDFPVLFLYPEGSTEFAAEVLEPDWGPRGKAFYRLELEGLRRKDFEAELKVSRYDF